MVSPFTPRALVFSTPPSSPLDSHPYLSSLNELPPRSFNPLPQTLSQGLSQTLPQATFMDFEPSFPPINLSRSRLSAQPEPFLSREQVFHQLSQYQDFNRHIEEAIRNTQNVQNSLLPPFTTTSTQMPPQYHFTATYTTKIPPFRSSFPPSTTFVPLDQSLWIEGPFIPPLQEYTLYILNKLISAKIGLANFFCREPVPSSCTGRFHCGDGTAKNRATVLAGSVPLHWPVSLSVLVNFLIGEVLPTLAYEIKKQGKLRARISHSLKIYLLISKHYQTS
ncbi:hypothetical protein Tco_0014292 [Tanacetum coccineum]